MFRFTVVAALAVVCGSSLGFAACYPGLLSPAQNYSAYYYRGSGGIGRASEALAIYAGGAERKAKDAVYPQSCGKGRKWDGQRCVDARGTK